MIRFVKKNIENKGACLIKKSHQRHLNFHLKLNSNFNQDAEIFKFSFCYDKTNSTIWHAILKPVSASSKHKTIYYYPVTTEQEESLSPQEALNILKQDLNCMQAHSYYSLMKYFTEKMFLADGSTHLINLEELYTYNSHQKSSLFNRPSCALFDHVATKVDMTDSVTKSVLIIQSYLSTMCAVATDKKANLLKLEMINERCFINNIFDFDTFKESFPYSVSIIPDIAKTKYIFQQYMQKRIHNAALTLHWFNAIIVQYNNELASALTYKRIYQALFVLDMILIATALTLLFITASPLYFLALAILTITAVCVEYKIHQTTISTATIKIEKGVAEQEFNNCNVFASEQNKILATYFLKVTKAFIPSPVSLSASGLSILSKGSLKSDLPDTDTEQKTVNSY